MSVEYHRGEWARPKGHAFIYMRNSLDHEEVWATYVVILPITVDLSKYVPPFLMNQIGEMDEKDLSAFAFPPAPEQVSGYDVIERMAEMRDDDILFIGTQNPSDVTGALGRVSEAVQSYSEQYAQITGSSTEGGEAPIIEQEEETEGLAVSDVIYGLMSDSDKLSELSKLIGRLRFAVDGSDDRLITETESEITLVANHLPQSHNIPQLVEAVKSNDSRSAELADVYLQRSYHLVHEDYAKLTAIEGRIKELEGGSVKDE
ncbi:MAG: hypothetical protein OXI33_02525 [Chloroflexota bacterium]|nr:hypothetical protein [Chloroflexota bacterium]